MDDTLQRLLNAELRAQEIAQRAEQERQRTVQQAQDEARVEEQRFVARIPDLHYSFIEKAESRAGQTIKELKRRYDERHARLRDLAEEHEEEALEAALKLLTVMERGI
jgi:V/A-type H+/Na+-transporting ATPase subunit G/H